MTGFRRAAASVVVSGVLMAVLYVPFTITHGPTSIDRGREILSADMHVWGCLLGVLPCTGLGLGLWRLRGLAAGARTLTRMAWTTTAVLLVLSAAQDLAFRALGPPFLYFLMVPALLVAAATHQPRALGDPPVRLVTALLSLVLLGGLAAMLFLQKSEDGFGSYRMATFLLYGAGGLAWAVLGVALARVVADRELTP